MQRAQQRAAGYAGGDDASGESDEEGAEDDAPVYDDLPPATPEEQSAENLAAETVLPEDLMAPSVADREKLALQYIDTLAPKSKKSYFSRLREFQVGASLLFLRAFQTC